MLDDNRAIFREQIRLPQHLHALGYEGTRVGWINEDPVKTMTSLEESRQDPWGVSSMNLGRLCESQLANVVLESCKGRTALIDKDGLLSAS